MAFKSTVMRNFFKFRLLWLLAIAALTVFSACKKDDPAPVQTVTDIDGNVYHVVTIGSQDWLVENLNVSHYRNGDAIPLLIGAADWETTQIGAYCHYNNSAANAATYGKLYNWYAVNDSREIAPVGWHVATTYDWAILTDYLGGEANAGDKLKEAGNAHWALPNDGATNSTGFKALPGGFRDYAGNFDYIAAAADFWTSTAFSEWDAWCRWLDHGAPDVYVTINGNNFGYSVRCVRD